MMLPTNNHNLTAKLREMQSSTNKNLTKKTLKKKTLKNKTLTNKNLT